LLKHKAFYKYAAENRNHIQLHAGFLPWQSACVAMTKDLKQALIEAKARGYVGQEDNCVVDEDHYSMFESTLTHRALHSSVPPTDVFRKIFLAKLLRDASLAHKLN
jgi:hypothetical protein